MWIVRVALQRPYTFVVLAVLILLASPVLILRTPTDIFPNINIPVIAMAWQFTGLNPEEMEGRITTQYERVLTTTVDNIEHIESTTVNGQSMVKIFLQPHARLDTANAQVTAVSQTILRQLPAGTQPPLIINYSASTVPILQLALSGMSEAELNDVGLNFLRTQLVTVPGASIPYPYGGKQRQVMVDLDQRLLQSKGLSPADVVTALGQQNIVLPSGTAKIGEFEYDVAMNASPRTVAELNDLPVKVVGNSTIYLRDVAHVRDGFAPQTNVVRRDGSRGTLVTILKTGTASTLDVEGGRGAGLQNGDERAAAAIPADHVRLRREAVAHVGDVPEVDRRIADHLDRQVVQLGHGPGAGVHGDVVFELADLRGAGRQDDVLLAEGGDDVGRGQPLRLEQALVQVDHDLALLAAVRIRDRGAGDGHELGPEEVEARVVELRLGQSRQGELQNGHRRRAVVDDQRRLGAGRQLAQDSLRHRRHLRVGGIEARMRLQEDLDHRLAVTVVDSMCSMLSTVVVRTRSYWVVIRPSISSGLRPVNCQATAMTGMSMFGKMSVGVRRTATGLAMRISRASTTKV